MKDISDKVNTRRSAVAQAEVRADHKALRAVRDNTTDKPDVLPTARAAAFLAVKNTHAVIPHCHPLPVEAVNVTFDLKEERMVIRVEVKTTYKTGCEMEALHGASIAALTVYDMLKPMDKDIEIVSVKLLKKYGGKSDYRYPTEGLPAIVIVCSDSVAAGFRTDKAGEVISEKLRQWGLHPEPCVVVPDEKEEIRSAVMTACEQGARLVITAGGTGLSPRDRTPDAVKDLIEKEAPGIMEAARAYGKERTPYAMLGRGVAGLRGGTLILTLPGSVAGALESMEALFPYVLHTFRVLEGTDHGMPVGKDV